MTALAETSVWSTCAYPDSSRYDAWNDQLNATFGSWQVSRPSSPHFDATVSSKNIGSMDIVECICDPCGGERTARTVSGVEDERLVIQLVLSGRENMRLGNQEAALSAGDLFVWDNTQPMVFEVTDRLHKISALLPLKRFKDWMPDTWRNVPRHVPSSSIHSALIGSYIQNLHQTDLPASSIRDSSLIEATIALLSSAINTSDEDKSVRAGQLAFIKTRICQHLHDPDLSLDRIAEQNKISTRYLHYLFGESGQTAWQFVMSERLERCRRDILNPAMRHQSITATAYAWGFSDAAHFSRSYKRAYGISPSQARQIQHS